MAFGLTLSNAMSSFTCCWHPPHHQDDSDAGPATLRTLPHSAVSMALPSSSVPHGTRARDDLDDAQALRDIFTSPSSVRGYQAASPLPKLNSDRITSFDANFRCGERSPEKKPGGRLEQLGHNIRQKLSENRLSKSSSKVTIKQDEPGHKHPSSESEKKTDEQALLLGISHRSTGLSDLLVSRNPSEGGYDSDAKSIETAMLRSNAGTIRISPAFTRQPLHAVDFTNGDNIGSGAARLIPEQKTPSSVSDRERSQSSPLPQTPSKTAFSAALQMGNNESPSDVLRRISVGVTDGTIKLPDTPELQAMQMPGILEANGRWSLSFTAPRRGSSLNKSGPDWADFLKSLNNRVESAKRASIVTTDTSEKHISLISDLDPTFVQYLSKYGETGSPNHSNLETEAPGYVDTSARNSTISLPQKSIAAKSIQSMSDNDKDSVHLFNMRISQRLASNSLIPVLSPSHSNVGSVNSQSIAPSHPDYSRDPPSFARFPSFIAQEHNKRPSDPQTRRLFENGVSSGSLHPKWKTVTSITSSTSNAKRPQLICDDASSCYESDAGLPSTGEGGSANPTRRNSIKNPNSIAVGGRSMSGSLPGKYESVGQLSTTEERAWLRKNQVDARKASEETSSLSRGDGTGGRERSMSMPKESRFHEAVGTPTPKARKYRFPTDANEVMSEISVDAANHGRNEVLSELSVGLLIDQRNEKLSEIDPHMLNGDTPNRRDSRRASAGWLSDGRRSGWGFDLVDKTPERCGQNKGVSEIGDVDDTTSIHESATNMWERALKKARDESLNSSDEINGGFLGVPKFDRLGRRKSKTRSSISLNGFHQEEERGRHHVTTPESRRSRSESGRESFSLEQHQRMCSFAREPLSRARSKSRSQLRFNECAKTIKEQGEDKPRKKSLLDIRRFTTINLPAGKDKDKSGTATPMKDFMSSWARFPMHTREDRNGVADENDGVEVKDFIPVAEVNDRKLLRPWIGLFGTPYASHSTAELGLQTPGSWRVPGLRRSSKQKSKSMTFRDGRIESGAFLKKRTGLIRNVKRLYRTRSAELRSYAMGYGHRSSISLSGNVEYPELEILPGEGLMGLAWRKNKEKAWEQKQDRNDTTARSPDPEVFSPYGFSSSNGESARKTRDWLTVTSQDDGVISERTKGLGPQLLSRESLGVPEARLPQKTKPAPSSENSNSSAIAGRKLITGAIAPAEDASTRKEDTIHCVVEQAGPSQPQGTDTEDLRASTVDFGNQLKEEMNRTSKELLRKAELFGGIEQIEGEEDPLELPPRFTECGLGAVLGKNGSCEDVRSDGGVDGA